MSPLDLVKTFQQGNLVLKLSTIGHTMYTQKNIFPTKSCCKI